MAGCSAPNLDQPKTANHPELAGKWSSRRKTQLVEWTFQLDGTYDALHQEGAMAAQVRGQYKWEMGRLVIKTDYVEPRSRDKALADRVGERIRRGYDLNVQWIGSDSFEARPTDGSEMLVFKRSN